MTGLGLQALGLQNLGVPAADPEPQTRSPLSSSRLIDGVTLQYVQTPEGGFEGMPALQQRVMLLVIRGAGPTPQTTDERSRVAIEQGIRLALEPLTSGNEPVAEIESITVERIAPGILRKVIKVRGLIDDRTHTVEL